MKEGRFPFFVLALFELKKYDKAVEVLTTFASDETWPADLRADALLHKAIILREQAKIEKKSVPRSAIIAENKAIEIVIRRKSMYKRNEVEKLRRRSMDIEVREFIRWTC